MNNIEAWFHGLAAAFIGGGASAVTAGFVAPAINPAAFNFHNQLWPLAQLALALFVVNGGLAAFAYLSKSPLPSMQTVTTQQTTSIQPIGDVVKVATVTKTTTTDSPKP